MASSVAKQWPIFYFLDEENPGASHTTEDLLFLYMVEA
jgi:hypothetical protein